MHLCADKHVLQPKAHEIPITPWPLWPEADSIVGCPHPLT